MAAVRQGVLLILKAIILVSYWVVMYELGRLL